MSEWYNQVGSQVGWTGYSISHTPTNFTLLYTGTYMVRWELANGSDWVNAGGKPTLHIRKGAPRADALTEVEGPDLSADRETRVVPYGVSLYLYEGESGDNVWVWLEGVNANFSAESGRAMLWVRTTFSLTEEHKREADEVMEWYRPTLESV